MKSIRKSLTGSKDPRNTISTPVLLPSVSKPPSSILPPQKVIKALAPFRSTAPQELSFKKGDFFYVLRDVNEGGAYYEAHNPVTGARGLVPRNMFEEFSKTLPIRNSQAGSNGSFTPPQSFAAIPPSPKSPKSQNQVFYAIVLHDFEAERADELDAKRGDAVTVVAQSNREWFVAKPIGRLGRPGLIPVSFVEIHDPSTGTAIPDVEALMDRGELPKVEDWKRQMFNYKQNSIALGVIDSPSTREPVANSPFAPQNQNIPRPSDPSIAAQGGSPRMQPQQPPAYANPPPPPSPPQQSEFLPEGILLSADCVSFHYEMDEYWFRIDAIFQPYSPPGVTKLPPAKQLILFRVYNDFYDFQVSLLDSFPREAGRQPPHARTLPFMPGPAQNVDDALTATRRAELDDYLHSLCDLSNAGGSYILEHQVVRDFLCPKPGDVENETEPRIREMDALFSDPPPDDFGYQQGANGRPAPKIGDIQTGMERIKFNDRDRSDGSDYEDEGYAPSPQRRAHEQDRHPYSQANDRRSNDHDLRLHAHAQNHQRNGSTSSIPRTYTSNSRSSSPAPARSDSPSHPYASQSSRWNSSTTANSSHNQSSPSISSLHSTTAPSLSGRSRSHSTATTNNFNSPQISSANPQTAFVKIKIFDRVADDLIAIRVHPRVTHAELMDKIQTRLGGEVALIRFRDSLNNSFVGLGNDQDLRQWIENTDKHVLYAD